MPALPGKKLVLCCVAALLTLSLFYDLRLTLNRGLVITDDIFASDLMNDRYPVRVELARGLKQGRLPLWTPLIYGGFPLQANPESGITYPLNIFFFGLFSPSWALNLSIILKFFLAGLFMFLYLRQIGIDPRAAFIGAIAFSWSGFFISHLKHLNMHDAAIWVPLLLFLLEKYRRRRSPLWLFLTAGVLGLQILAGHPQISYYTVFLVIGYYLWIEWPYLKTIRHAPRSLAYLFILLALALGLGMVQLLPGYELTNWSERVGGIGYGFAVQHKYWLRNLLTFIYPFVNGDPGRATYHGSGVFWEDYGYLGLLPLFFAGYALVKAFRKNRHVKFFTVLAAASLVLMLGDQALLFKILFYVVPGMKFFRFSQRFILFVDLSLAALASIGLDRAFKNRPAWAFLLVIGLTIPDLYIMQKRQNPVVSRDRWEALPATAQVILRDPTRFRVYTLGGSESHMSAYVMAQGWEGDLTPYVRQRSSLQPSANMLDKIASNTGYINLVPRHLIRLWGNEKVSGLITKTAGIAANNLVFIPREPFLKIMNAYNVKYLVSIWRIDHPELEPLGLFNGFQLYRNRSVQPRAFFVPQAVAASDEKAESLFVAGAVDLRRQVLLADTIFTGTATDTTGTAAISIIELSGERLVVDAETPADGWIFLSDTYYPGWRAELDGRPVQIHRANICGRAIAVGAGKHKIEFIFRSKTYLIGSRISLLALVLIGIGLIACLVRQKNSPTAVR